MDDWDRQCAAFPGRWTLHLLSLCDGGSVRLGASDGRFRDLHPHGVRHSAAHGIVVRRDALEALDVARSRCIVGFGCVDGFARTGGRLGFHEGVGNVYCRFVDGIWQFVVPCVGRQADSADNGKRHSGVGRVCEYGCVRIGSRRIVLLVEFGLRVPATHLPVVGGGPKYLPFEREGVGDFRRETQKVQHDLRVRSHTGIDVVRDVPLVGV